MKCGIVVRHLKLSNRYRMWFGPDAYANDWELSLMVHEDEIEMKRIKIARNRLEPKYKRLCQRLKVGWCY
jgi:hypothetical protein